MMNVLDRSKLTVMAALITTAFSITGQMAFAESGDEKPSEQAAAPSTKKVLQGGVDHAEELPALSDSLRPGKIFSDDLLNKSGATNDVWYYIPAWFAGTRHVEDVMIVYRYDYKTGQTTTPMQRQLNRQDSLSGYLKDKNGGIWDYKAVPVIQHVESDNVNAIIYVQKITPVMGNEDRIVLKFNELSITVSKKQNKILQVFQQEQINTITSPVPGTLHIDISVKCFDYDGTPQRLEQSVSIAKIAKPFTEEADYKGKNLRPLFRDYLVSHNLSNLVPDDLTTQTH